MVQVRRGNERAHTTDRDWSMLAHDTYVTTDGVFRLSGDGTYLGIGGYVGCAVWHVFLGMQTPCAYVSPAYRRGRLEMTGV
jgi:hypothetical protein